MLEKRFKLEIVTPERVLFKGEVEGVKAPGVAGSFQILAGHTPFLTLLETGEVSFQESGTTTETLAASGGVLEALRTGVTILLETSERAEEIDVERAEQARDRARQRLAQRTPDIDITRAEAALQRALNRLKIAGRV